MHYSLNNKLADCLRLKYANANFPLAELIKAIKSVQLSPLTTKICSTYFLFLDFIS